MLGLLPQPIVDIFTIARKIAPQRQYHGENMFRHGVHGVIPDIGNDDAMRAAIVEIDVVGARGANRDHFEVLERRETGGHERNLVADGDGRIA